MGLVVLSIVGWRKRVAWLKWGAGLTALGMAVLGCLAVGLLGYGIYWSSRPANVFQETFGESPSAAVSDVQSRLYWFADNGEVRLRFHTTSEEFDRLVPPDLMAIPADLLRKKVGYSSGSQPEWWSFQFEPSWRYHWREHTHEARALGKKGFYWELEIYAYDPATKTAYYRFSGID